MYEYQLERSDNYNYSSTPPIRRIVGGELDSKGRATKQRPETDEEYRERIKEWKPPLTFSEVLNNYAADGWRVIAVSIDVAQDRWAVVFERKLTGHSSEQDNNH